MAALALVLAAVNLRVISCTVTQRTHEFGIRMALGAQQKDVLGIVLSHGAKLASAGVLIGMALAFALTRAIASLLFGVSASDPWTFAAVAGVLVGVALAALLHSCAPRHAASSTHGRAAGQIAQTAFFLGTISGQHLGIR